MGGCVNPKTYLLLAAFSLTVMSTALAGIIYVDADAPGAKNGLSWADAYNYLQDALADANSAVKPVEIRVAQGIYTPDSNSANPNGSGDREATFHLINGVTLKGGYAGFGTTDANTRNFELYETVLSGDLKGDDGPNFANRGENSFHVIVWIGTYLTTKLDGFTITAGYANGPYLPVGAGICLDWCDYAEITNCIIMGNVSIGDGAGMYIGDSSPKMINCIFIGNLSGSDGGGMYVHITDGASYPVLINCTFSGNFAGWADAAGWGGGIMGYVDSIGLTNCIFWNNSDTKGMGESVQLCIRFGTVAVNHSCIQDWSGSLGGTGNIGTDPRFVDPGYWDTDGLWIYGDYHLLPGSPCIDTGDPNYIAEPNEADLDGKPRVIGGRIDMGAYEYEYGQLIHAEARIVPRTINLGSKGNWITAILRLGKDFNVGDIEPNSVLLENAIQAEMISVDEQQQVAIARFSRQELQDILTIGKVGLTITGRLTDGTIFEAIDVIIVINKGGRKSAKQEKTK